MRTTCRVLAFVILLLLPEISRLSSAWLVLPTAAPCAIVACLPVLRQRAPSELATLEAARWQFDEP